MTDASKTIYLADYQPPAYLVDSVELTFRLHPTATRVISKISFRPNPASGDHEFKLDGEDLKLIWAKIDGEPVESTLDDEGLSCGVPNAAFIWEAEVEIDPQGNTALEGLYMSNGMYCTQCEAEGFRKITYYPDRPDVMAKFTVRIESDDPVKLSNGNPLNNGEGFSEWHDPWPKPAYLFALVAGDLIAHPDTFTTKSGRKVDLNIYVRPGDEHKCAFGMDALKRSMRWDEEVYGREYDLDIFNIVAVDDFNMGAMENKGLNIFNSSCVLASPETATDGNYENIEAIIAHEYFHNWTGNRITCRDWFQLCLKEGLTVFRDQQFTGDMRSHAVKRIDDANVMRNYQFREDAGPLAHPVRPESFVEINNFYTATVYEKGAEVIGMLKRLVGDDAYYRALTLYFDRHDGEAATIEDWLKVFEETTGRDLTQFKRWYQQAGTPRVTVRESFEDGVLTLQLSQSTQPTPGQKHKDPLLIPITLGMLSKSGAESLATQVLELSETDQTFTFDNLPERPKLSLLREFSAPVILDYDQSAEDLAFLLAQDTDPFNRWDAGRRLASMILKAVSKGSSAPDTAYLDGITAVIRDDNLDPAFRAQMLALPAEQDTARALFEDGISPEPLAIHHAHEALRLQLSQHLQDVTPRLFAQMQVEGPYSPDATSAGKRALGNAMLSLMSRLDGGRQARQQFASADNMTQQMAALSALLKNGVGGDAAEAFYTQWKSDKLVVDKWFAVQVATSAPELAVATAQRLTEHTDFQWKNPNRFRAVLGALAGNTAGFHMADGSGYRFFADWLIKLDAVNPQTAARMTSAFDSWRMFDPQRQEQIKTELSRIQAASKLSTDTTEMVARMLSD